MPWVLAAIHSENVGGTVFTEYVQADYRAIHGDSGAAVAYNRYVGSATTDYVVMGVQSASHLVDEAWVDGTSYSLFTRVDNIHSALGLTNP